MYVCVYLWLVVADALFCSLCALGGRFLRALFIVAAVLRTVLAGVFIGRMSMLEQCGGVCCCRRCAQPALVQSSVVQLASSRRLAWSECYCCWQQQQ